LASDWSRSLPMLRVLILSEDASLAERMLLALRSAGLACAGDRVSTESDFRAALARVPDVILSTLDLTEFDGLTALSIVSFERPTTPFILLAEDTQEPRLQQALQRGAAGLVSPTDAGALSRAVRGVLQPAATALRRVSDQAEPAASPKAGSETAGYLLERQTTLQRTLQGEDDVSLTSILSRTPPTPAALVVIQNAAVRERYLKVLHNARIDTEVASDATDACVQLAARIHALLFTDQLDMIAAVRQLSSGAATHVVYVGRDDPAVISEALRAGANDTMPDSARGEHFWSHLSTARRFVSFASSLRSAVTDNRILSTIDELTRCGNRRYFEQQFPREVVRAMRLRRPLALLMCDIDHFKTINDQHGHTVGDEVLHEIGDRLTHGLRLGEDWVARIGGEEFAIVLPETGRFRGLAVAERLRQGLTARPFETSSGSLTVTASFGVCGLQRTAPDMNDLRERMIAAADAALYESKRNGRNRVTAAEVLERPL